VQKYQGMSCEQLWAQKAQPKSAEEQRAIDLMSWLGAAAPEACRTGRV
jgi:hypothetical protein